MILASPTSNTGISAMPTTAGQSVGSAGVPSVTLTELPLADETKVNFVS